MAVAPDHYKTLGLNSSATGDEIRRAYRVLARRYHPDVNPGKSSEEKFKIISEAYSILSDQEKRSKYDLEYERDQLSHFAEKLKSYNRANFTKKKSDSQHSAKPQSPPKAPAKKKNRLLELKNFKNRIAEKLKKVFVFKKKNKTAHKPENFSLVLEVSVSMRDAIYGIKKTIEIGEPANLKKLSIVVPAGVRNGTVLRIKDPKNSDIILILRVAQHPFISIQNKGIVVEVPVSINEAIFGASITLPTLEEPVLIKIPPGSQSGNEIRAKGKGIKSKEGETGDIIYRLLVKVPDAFTAIGLKDKSAELERYYHEPVRKSFPNSLLG